MRGREKPLFDQRESAAPGIMQVDADVPLRLHELGSSVHNSTLLTSKQEDGSADRIDRILNLVNSSFTKLDRMNQAVI